MIVLKIIILSPQVHIGVKGFVKALDGTPIANAEIKVINLASGLPIDHDILSCKCWTIAEHKLLTVKSPLKGLR